MEATGAVGMVSKAGRYGGGTFAHCDIALEFCAGSNDANLFQPLGNRSQSGFVGKPVFHFPGQIG